MKTPKLFSTVITGTRLLLLIAMLMAAVLGSVQRADAAPLLSLQTISVGAQTGSLVAGTAGSVTFDITVTRTGKNPNNVSFNVTGLPAEATFSIGAPTDWSSQSRTYPLTISTTAAAAAGETVFTVSSNSGTNTTISGPGTLTILAAGGPQTITFDPLADKTFGDPDFTVRATASSGLPVSFAAGGNCTVAGDLVSLSGAGSCTITASQAGDGSIWDPAADVPQTFAIAKAGQTITFDPLPNRYAFEPSFTVSATASSGLPVSFSAVGECTVAGNMVSLSGIAGLCTITASQVGDTNFNAALDVSQTFTISDVTGISIDLYADEGSTTLAGTSIPIWGYYETGGAVTQPGGPVLDVNEGEVVIVTLHNNLTETTSLLFQGQDMIPDVTGVPAGESKTYVFTANRPGTYLYEAGLLPNASHQVAMGLYGALVVLPATPGQAYGTGTDFDDEAVLVLSDLDPALNTRANPATFDMRNYSPKYFLINGKVYPATDSIATTAGKTVLLRYVNAGLQAYSMSLLGVRQTMIAMDGSPFTYGRSLVAETLASGQTADMLVNIPAAAAAGSQYALYDANLFLHNNKSNNSLTGSFGGMLTFLSVSGTPGTGDTLGPLTNGLSVTATSVSATISDFDRGDSNVTAAEFFIDTTGASGSGTAMTGAFGTITVNVSGVINPALSGSHTVYVHGQDAAGNWGPFQSVLFGVDATGPATSALVLSPNPSNGTVIVGLSGSASDTASGGSNIAAAEYSIDGGAAVSMTVSPSGAQVASLTASIPAATVNGLSQGTHVVSVRSQDSLGNWGAVATINLAVDKTGPAISGVSAAPNPNNGTIAFNSSTPAVRVTAYSTDTASNISAMEGFIDTVGANGTGIIFLPVDGLFNSSGEAGYVDILLSTIAALSDGNHTIYVHAKDAAGNWGATSTTILVIDKTAPTISSVSLTPSTIAFGAVSVTLNVTASDGTGTGVSGGQFWIDGTATPPANATAFTGTSATIDTSALAGGVHTVYARVRDGATNWSTVSSVTLYVVQAVNDSLTITANGSTTQTITQGAPGVLANDQPVGVAGRTAAIASGPVRISGTGAGTIAVTLNSNGSYTVTLTGVGNNNNQRASSKRGTFTFTYTETLNGATSTATVTIIVN